MHEPPRASAAALEDHALQPPERTTLSRLLSAADATADRIADRLAEHDGSAAPPILAILAEEGLFLLLCQMAAMRSRCAFLLIDPALPVTRVEYLLSDSRAVLLLLDSPPLDATKVLSTPTMAVFEHTIVDALDDAEEDTDDVITQLFPQSLSQQSLSQQLCYVCYTSGSTGRPKGCAITRASLEAYARANAHAHSVGPTSRVLLASAVSFDPCIGEAWTALVAGATLCLPARSAVKQALGPLLAATGATHVCSTPALWTTVQGGPAAHPALRHVTLGGERMSASIMETWTACVWCQLHNVYGVTECTVYQSSSRISPAEEADRADEADRAEEAALLGMPLPGNALILVGEDRMPMLPPPASAEPQGERSQGKSRRAQPLGQLAICGGQVALGYLHRPELTAERFVTLHSTALDSVALESVAEGGREGGRGGGRGGDEARGTRAYLTGDLACWQLSADGTPVLRLCGRMDNQVAELPSLPLLPSRHTCPCADVLASAGRGAC